MTTSHFHLSDTWLQRPVNSTLFIASVWIINHIYAGFTNSLTFSLWSSTAAGDRLQIELLSKILTSVRDTELTYIIENNKDIQCADIRSRHVALRDICLVRMNVILIVDSFEAFMLSKRQLEKPHFFKTGFYTILYTARDQRYYDTIVKMFLELSVIYVTNVNIYVEVSNETLIYTYYPFTQHQCYSSIPVLYNRFTMEKGYMFAKPFFPKKTSNFYKCKVTVATWHEPPFMILSNNSNGEISATGIEGTLIWTLSDKMNFTMKILRTASRGVVFANLTAPYGAVKMVIDGEANITINTFIYSRYAVWAMLASYTYTSYPVIVAVPQGYPLTGFERLMRPFKYIIWSCLSSSVLAGIAIIFIIKFLRKRMVSDFVFGPLNNIPFTNLLNVLFGGPVTLLPQRNFARYILFLWLLYTMVLRSAYTGELFILLQDSRMRTGIKTIQEVVNKNFTLMCTGRIIEILRTSTHANQIRRIREHPFEYLAKLHNSESKLAVVILRPFLKSYNWINRGSGPIQAVPETLVTAPLAMYFRRSSYLLDVVNEHLLAFMGAGLTNMWSEYYQPKEAIMQDDIGKEPTVLSVHLLIGLFCIYLFLMGLTSLVFALEVWSKQSPICRRVMNFLNY